MSEIGVAPGLCVRQSFSLFGQMADAVQGWDLDFQQLSASSDPCWLEQFSTAEMLYSRASFGSHFHQLGGPVLGFRTFALRAQGCTDFRWCGEMVYPLSLIVFPAGGEFESVSMPGFDIFTISLSNALLTRIAESEFQRPLLTLLGEQGQVCQVAGGAVRSLRMLLHRFSNELGGRGVGVSELPGSPQWRGLDQVLASRLLACLDQDRATAPRDSRGNRMKALEKAIELIRWQLPHDIRIPNLRVSGLASQVGVSRRTLENAFQDGIGVSPAAYIKATRLQALNRHLLEATGTELSVASICHQHGFSHLGQLASDYRAMYGELPSLTLRRG